MVSATIIGGRLRLRFDPRSGSIGSEAPTLQAGFVPQEVVFLARGAAPYSLAWGSADVAPANLPLSTLLPGYRSGTAPAGSMASVQVTALAPVAATANGKPAKEQAAAAPGQSKWLLWSVLGIGLLVNVSMRRQMFRS